MSEPSTLSDTETENGVPLILLIWSLRTVRSTNPGATVCGGSRNTSSDESEPVTRGTPLPSSNSSAVAR